VSGDEKDDQLHGQLEPEQRGDELDRQVDSEIADQGPFEPEPRRIRGAELDCVAAHVAGQIDQRRNLQPKQRDGGQDRVKRLSPSAGA
jgi:hypothetical protein